MGSNQSTPSYIAVIERAGTSFSAYVPELPGCIATGPTVEQVKSRITAALKTHLRALGVPQQSIPPQRSIAFVMSDS